MHLRCEMTQPPRRLATLPRHWCQTARSSRTKLCTAFPACSRQHVSLKFTKKSLLCAHTNRGTRTQAYCYRHTPTLHHPRPRHPSMSLLKSRANESKSSSKGIPQFGGKWGQREYGGMGVAQARTEETDAEITAMEQRLQVKLCIAQGRFVGRVNFWLAGNARGDGRRARQAAAAAQQVLLSLKT